MNITELTLVQTRLNALISKPVCEISREADMLLVTFGDHEVTLRIQCYYRLTERGAILLARNDVYQPSEQMWDMWRQMGYEEDYIPEDFHSDAPGANRMDERLAQLTADLSGLMVRAALVNQLGDLTLCFVCGATLTIMSDTSGGEECWRLMSRTDCTDDLVVYGDGVELQPQSGTNE